MGKFARTRVSRQVKNTPTPAQPQAPSRTPKPTDLTSRILQLQRTVGNQAVGQLLGNWKAQPAAAPSAPSTPAETPSVPLSVAESSMETPSLQRKLTYDSNSFATEFGKSDKSGFKTLVKLLKEYETQYKANDVNLDAKATLDKMVDVCNDLLKKDLAKDSPKHTKQKDATNNLLADIRKELTDIQQKAQPGRDEFAKLAKGGVKEAEAPGEISLPDELHSGMAKAWEKSLPKGKSQEQGGILVMNDDGTYEWKPGKAGKSGSFTPDFGAVGDKQTLVGSGHTHPYSKKEGGDTDVSFSGDDISTMIVTGEKMVVVQSGAGRFVVSSTEEFEALVKSLKDDDAKDKKMKEMNDLWDEKFGAAKGTFQQKVEIAVKALCAKYHLVYYKGDGGKLAKQ